MTNQFGCVLFPTVFEVTLDKLDGADKVHNQVFGEVHFCLIVVEIARKVSQKGLLGDLVEERCRPLTHTAFEVFQVGIGFSEFPYELAEVHSDVLLVEGRDRYALRKLADFRLLRFFEGLLDCLFL